MRRAFFLGWASIAWLAGCSSVSVVRDYDASFDFSSLQTFAWQHADQPRTGNPRTDNDLIDERVRDAVNAELTAKGFRLVDRAAADFLLAYFIEYRQRIGGSSVSFGIGGGSYGRYGGASYGTNVSDYEEGALTIDIINPADEKNYWRGVGRRTTYDRGNPEKTTKVVNAAVADILKKFPPGK
ncbi:hypothetical protein PDESU_03789 [Pontiella desulfatans]|uniref:DUF4136 domain-containing protein n=1 Tax=Pontiella desulfatans TaxID=2750659 RepID=A0A6C2U5X6_PONDE|nr:DUF4136 domain-containing protein [Pontiella desulfatans]VGO15207.1 hypothetical protein PDESU_03789 [Pontiella desulfatans]